MINIGHLNTKGANLFTQTCALLVTKKLEEQVPEKIKAKIDKAAHSIVFRVNTQLS